MNNLNFLKAEEFLPATKLENITVHPNCIVSSKNFKWNKTVIATANCDSDIFLHPYLRSLYKQTSQDDFSLVIFDNSFSTKFNADIYINHGFKNIFFIDNTCNYLDAKHNRGVIDVPDIISDYTYYGSRIHCLTIDFLIKYLYKNGVENLILTDSDVIFKTNPLGIIDSNYISVGEYEEKFTRLCPYFTYLNLKKINELNMNYYDETRLIGMIPNVETKYDTGGSFFEDLNKIPNSIKYVDIYKYIDHFGAGSYAFAGDFVGGEYLKDIENKPQVTYNMIWDWITKNHWFIE